MPSTLGARPDRGGMRRRAFLTGAGTLIAAAGLRPAPAAAAGPIAGPGRPASRLDALVSTIIPDLTLANANTGERLSCRFFTATGYDRAALRDLNWFMRDWREGETARIDVRCLWALAALRQAAMKDGFDGEVRFLSGYRTRATNDLLRRRGIGAAPNSLHIAARAVDFTFPGVSVAAIFAYARWLQIGGVGHYPGRFVHIDTGPTRDWVGGG